MAGRIAYHPEAFSLDKSSKATKPTHPLFENLLKRALSCPPGSHNETLTSAAIVDIGTERRL